MVRFFYYLERFRLRQFNRRPNVKKNRRVLNTQLNNIRGVLIKQLKQKRRKSYWFRRKKTYRYDSFTVLRNYCASNFKKDFKKPLRSVTRKKLSRKNKNYYKKRWRTRRMNQRRYRKNRRSRRNRRRRRRLWIIKTRRRFFKRRKHKALRKKLKLSYPKVFLRLKKKKMIQTCRTQTQINTGL